MNNRKTLPAPPLCREDRPVRALADDVDAARQRRLAVLKDQLQAGTYRPSAGRIAEALWTSGDLAAG